MDQDEDRRSKELMARLRAGDMSAAGDLYDIHAERVTRITIHFLDGEQELSVEEVSANVWYEILENPSGPTEDRVPFECWLRGVVRNCCKSFHRAKGKLRRRAGRLALDIELPGGEPLTLDHLDDPVLRKKLDRAIAGLKSPQRVALELNVFEGLTCAEIAKRFQESPGTIEARVRAAKKTLKDALGREDR